MQNETARAHQKLDWSPQPCRRIRVVLGDGLSNALKDRQQGEISEVIHTEQISEALESADDHSECNLIEPLPRISVSARVVGGQLVVDLKNTVDERAEVQLGATTVSADGIDEVSNLQTVRLGTSANETVRLPLAAVGLADEDTLADVTITAFASYDDGQKSGNSTIVEVGPTVRASLLSAVERVASRDPNTVIEGVRAAYVEVDEPAEAEGVMASVAKTLCFRTTVGLVNSGIGEDVWTNNAILVPARGQRLAAAGPNTGVTVYYLDGNGCVAGNFEPGQWSFVASPEGFVNGTKIQVLRQSDNALLGTGFSTNVTSSTQTQYIGFTATLSTTLYHIVQFALRNQFGALTSATKNKTLTVYSYAAATQASSANVQIAQARMNNKWSIVHEMGHYVMRNEANTGPSDFTRDTVTCALVGSHSAGSREYNSGASNEGFASFFSAAVWNDENENSCWAHFSGSNINCEDASTGFPIQKMETDCPGGTGTDPFDGDGNETDWMRTYWDLTDPWISVQQVTIREILDFLVRGNGWSQKNYYDVLEAASLAAGTPSYLEQRWDYLSYHNGIDH